MASYLYAGDLDGVGGDDDVRRVLLPHDEALQNELLPIATNNYRQNDSLMDIYKCCIANWQGQVKSASLRTSF